MKNIKDIIKDIRDELKGDLFNEWSGHVKFLETELSEKIEGYDDYMRLVNQLDSDDYANAHFNLGYEYALREVERRLNAS